MSRINARGEVVGPQPKETRTYHHVPQNEYHKMKPKEKEKALAARIEVIAAYICAEVLMTMAREVMGGKRG